MIHTRSQRARRRASAAALASAAAVLILVAAGSPGLAWGAAGDLDPAFGGASHGRVTFDLARATHLDGLAEQPDGGVVVVGSVLAGGAAAVVAARFHADGSRDAGFGTAVLPGGGARAVVAQPDGKVVVTGDVRDSGGSGDIGVWRLQPTGALDLSFGHNGFQRFGTAANEIPFDIALDSRGRIIVAGASDADMVVVRLASDGVPDTTFNAGQSFFLPSSGGSNAATGVAVQADDKILLTGYYDGAIGLPVVRVNPGTVSTPATLDPGFGGGDGKVDVTSLPGSFGYDVAVDARGRILALGQATPFTDVAVVRLTEAGDVDTGYGSESGVHLHRDATRLVPERFTVLPSGSVAVAGNDGDQGFLAKIEPNGTKDTRMGPGGIKILPHSDAVVDIAAQTDGRIVFAGVTSAGGGVIYRILGDLKAPTCAGKRATIVGTKDPDTLVGTKHADVIAGLGGGDTITGLGKGDTICGGPGNDHLSGGAGPDRLFGGSGHDILTGGPGPDTVHQ